MAPLDLAEDVTLLPASLDDLVCLLKQFAGFGDRNRGHKTRKISGIIDFGSAGLGDPAVDLAAVSTYGEPFFEMIRENYPGVDALLTRARFHHGTFALQEAFHGFHNGDQKAFENEMAAYRDRLGGDKCTSNRSMRRKGEL